MLAQRHLRVVRKCLGFSEFLSNCFAKPALLAQRHRQQNTKYWHGAWFVAWFVASCVAWCWVRGFVCSCVASCVAWYLCVGALVHVLLVLLALSSRCSQDCGGSALPWFCEVIHTQTQTDTDTDTAIHTQTHKDWHTHTQPTHTHTHTHTRMFVCTYVHRVESLALSCL